MPAFGRGNLEAGLVPSTRFKFMPTITLLDETPVDRRIASFQVFHGAVLEFLGVVREMEGERKLQGIRYSGYEPMIQKLMGEMVARAEAAHGEHDLYLHHRLGLVLVGEPSVIIRVGTGHSREAFQLCEQYLAEVKKTLPIWKDPVFA